MAKSRRRGRWTCEGGTPDSAVVVNAPGTTALPLLEWCSSHPTGLMHKDQYAPGGEGEEEDDDDDEEVGPLEEAVEGREAAHSSVESGVVVMMEDAVGGSNKKT